MGPSILFDKSAIQALACDALHEVSRYFYTVVPPVLLMETLADLSLKPDDLEGARTKVAEIANKVFPIDSIANAHYHQMCIHNLLGYYIPMDRRPAVAGARPVTAKDGTKGLLIDLQPGEIRCQSAILGELKGDSHQIWRTQRVQVNVASLRSFLRSRRVPGTASSGDTVRIFRTSSRASAPRQRLFFLLP